MGMTIIIALVTFLVGGLLVWFVMRILMKSRYDAVIREAEKESEVMKQKKLLEVKEKFLHLKADLEKQVSARNSKIQSVEAKLKQRELGLNQRQEDLQRRAHIQMRQIGYDCVRFLGQRSLRLVAFDKNMGKMFKGGHLFNHVQSVAGMSYEINMETTSIHICFHLPI